MGIEVIGGTGSGHVDYNRITFNCIYGCYRGIHLDGVSNDIHIASNVIKGNSILWGTFGVTGSSSSYQVEDNYIYLGYVAAVKHVLYLSNSVARMQNNYVTIGVLELHIHETGDYGMTLYGNTTQQNIINILGLYYNESTINIARCISGAHDNLIILPGTDWTKTTKGNNIIQITGQGRTTPTADTTVRTVVWGDAAPAVGAWIVGDVCYNSDPASDEYAGWTCTVARSPGTWKGFGTIA